ncbi:MAG: DUF4968 domain-containing protein [Saprospiraceae bacterium]|nr:DUF4968 domain-containing protein [Saprospiraceae bacterium]
MLPVSSIQNIFFLGKSGLKATLLDRLKPVLPVSSIQFRVWLCAAAFVVFLNQPFAQSRLSFDGYNDYVELVGGVDFPPPWTFECWVQRSGVQPYSHLMTSTDGTTGIRLEQYINNGKVGITKGGVADWQYNYSALVGAWQHLAVVNNGTTMTLFINGLQKGSITGTINMPMGKIGVDLFGAGALLAKVDEVRIWGAALSAQVLAQHMNMPVTPVHPNYAALKHYFPLDEGAGDTTQDVIGGLTGVIHGASWQPVFAKDLEVTALMKPARFVTAFTTADSVNVRLANVGSSTINEDFDVTYLLDGGAPVTQTVVASTQPIAPNGVRDVRFPLRDLTNSDIHSFRIFSSLSGEQFFGNDTLTAISGKQQISLGAAYGFQVNGNTLEFDLGVTRVAILFYRPDLFRLWLAATGNYTNPTSGLLLEQALPESDVSIQTDESNPDYWQFTTEKIALRVFRNPFRLSVWKADGSALIWEENQPISYGQNARQIIATAPDEYFYGGGMQNGYFAHRDKILRIENDYSNNWGIGSIPNPAPFLMSGKGYGFFRNTFETGSYDIASGQLLLSHKGSDFDAFYFFGGDMKSVLEGYTYITGRPFMIPRWGLEFGDADCYNDTGTTLDGFTNIAKKYRQFNMPGGWMLPNDGYSCGYENLETMRDSLQHIGFRLGLWTEDGTSAASYEVGQAGVGVYKLDVALVGPGYRSAFESGLNAWNGIEQNSNRRGYIWTVAGWAGTQRFATVWSGDQSGNFNNLKMHIPTVIGAGLSGFNCSTGDIDGIFGGSAMSYTRDLQWKCFTPAMMTISGWASLGKQPWVHGGNYTIANRLSLERKMRLTPYLYSYCREANLSGVPVARGMVLEFPDDPICQSAKTQYQFMSGEWLLVAPVLSTPLKRDSIYLPAGKWFDWYDGAVFEGPTWLNNFSAPLSKIPVFARAGAIIPEYPLQQFDGQRLMDTLTVHVWPKGESKFDLYEDDGYSKAFHEGAGQTMRISASGPQTGFAEPVGICAGQPQGSPYEGQLNSRDYKLVVHFGYLPANVALTHAGQTTSLPRAFSAAELNGLARGWFYETGRGGITHIKLGALTPVGGGGDFFCVELSNFSVSAAPEIAVQVQINVFPSPSRGQFTVEVEDGETIKEVQVTDATGKLVLRRMAEATSMETIDLSAWPGGVYWLTVATEQGIVVRKVVLE